LKKIILNTIIVLISNLLFSQSISLPYNDTIKSFDVIVKTKGDSIKYDEYAYFKKDSSKIAWIKHVSNGKTVSVYREFFINSKTHKKQIYTYLGLKDGIYQEWNSKGELTVSGQYNKGKKDGTWLYIKDKRHEVYKNGIKHGRWRIYEGKTPWTLYVYRKDTIKKIKK